MHPTERFNRTAQILHWLVAGLIFCQYVLGSMAEDAHETNRIVAQLALLANHKSVGMTILALAIIRLGWRLSVPPPALPDSLTGWQAIAAKTAHILIYSLIFILPISGWLMSSASAYSVSWFNLFAFPDLIQPNPSLEGWLKDLHHLCAKALFVVVMLHILAALKHHFFDKDGVAMRMVSGLGLALFAIVFASGVWALTQTSGGESRRQQSESETPAAVIPQPTVQPTNHATTRPTVPPPGANAPPPWQIDHASSHIRFKAEQAGAEFEGTWDEWSADVRFDPADLAASFAAATIQIGSANTQDSDRDATLQDQDWFHTEQFPTATFRATTFRTSDTGLIAEGELIIKSMAVPVEFVFTVDESSSQWTLDGTARLDRLAHKLGLGDWQDTTWVSQFVTVDVHIEAGR